MKESQTQISSNVCDSKITAFYEYVLYGGKDIRLDIAIPMTCPQPKEANTHFSLFV